MCPLYCPSPSTDFLWAAHSQSSQKLGKNWLSLKYKQMELFSCTSKSAFELFVYTPFTVQTFVAWLILESSTHVSVTGHNRHINSGSLVSCGCAYCTSIILLNTKTHKTRKHHFHVTLFVAVACTVFSILTQPNCLSCKCPGETNIHNYTMNKICKHRRCCKDSGYICIFFCNCENTVIKI